MASRRRLPLLGFLLGIVAYGLFFASFSLSRTLISSEAVVREGTAPGGGGREGAPKRKEGDAPQHDTGVTEHETLKPHKPGRPRFRLWTSSPNAAARGRDQEVTYTAYTGRHQVDEVIAEILHNDPHPPKWRVSANVSSFYRQEGEMYELRGDVLPKDDSGRDDIPAPLPPHLQPPHPRPDPGRPPDARRVALANSLPPVRVRQIDCSRLTEPHSPETMEKAQRVQEAYKLSLLSKDHFIQWTSDCSRYKTLRGYMTDPVTKEEADFPIAYSIIFHKHVQQFERLLRAIYRPQNYYCLHLDTKAVGIRRHTEELVKCFDNVFLASRMVDVRWGTETVLEPELICMRDLLQRPKWKYFINLTGREFPLRTNWELVHILRAFNGSNQGGVTVKGRSDKRYHDHFPVPTIHGQNVTLAKGPLHVAFVRSMVEFVVHDPDVQRFYDWVTQTSVPDETFFAVLNHSPQVGAPGAYKGVPETSPPSYPFLMRYKIWNKASLCAGRLRRGICVFGLGDLPKLTAAPKLFANKFVYGYEPFAYDCLEEWFYNRTRQHVLGFSDLNATWYQQFNFTWNHT